MKAKELSFMMGAGVTCGVLAALLGIGGGMVVGPLLLEFKYPTPVVTATTAFMLLFTASATVGQYLYLGKIRWELALWYVCMGLLASVLGQGLLAAVIRRFKSSTVYLT